MCFERGFYASRNELFLAPGYHDPEVVATEVGLCISQLTDKELFENSQFLSAWDVEMLGPLWGYISQRGCQCAITGCTQLTWRKHGK